MAPAHQSNQQFATDPVSRQLHRAFFALCVLLAPLTVSLWFGLCPEYGNPACPVGTGATLAAFRAASPLLLQLFFVLAFISAYIYPLSYIGLGRLAMKRSPWLSSIGIALGFVGSVVWSLLMGESFWVNAAAHLNVNAQFFLLGKTYVANWVVFAMHGGWIIGHLFGYVLLGIALLRARVIPRWAAWLLIVSPLLIGAYGFGLIVVSIFRTDPTNGFPPGVAAATHPSWHGAIHALGGLFVFVMLSAALAVFVRLFLAWKERWWAFYCLASAVLLLLIFFTGFSNAAFMARTLRLATLIGWMAASLVAIKLLSASDTTQQTRDH